MNFIVVNKDKQKCLINPKMIVSISQGTTGYKIKLIDNTIYSCTVNELHSQLLFNKSFQLMEETEENTNS